MLTVFLPCRAGSERVPKKNTKKFAGIQGGLLLIKLNQLIKTKSVDKIVLSSNDPLVFEIASEIQSQKIVLDNRPEDLANSSTSTDDLIKYVPSVIDSEHILWTHVTSPFINSLVYEDAINNYFLNIKKFKYDSLMSVNKIQTFLWNENQPLNYNRNDEKWPRTQTLPVYYEINSGFFISSKDNYIKYDDRIGQHPFLYETKHMDSFDIDWPEDFELAEFIFSKRNQ